MVRLVVEAVPKYAVPEVVSAVVEAKVMVVFPKVLVPVKVLLVYVLGMVVELLMYEFTPVLKSETWEAVTARLESVVMLATDVVPASSETKEDVARVEV
jgi:hypothetical protein